MANNPNYLSLPDDSEIDLRRLEQISSPHASEFFRLLTLMQYELPSPTSFGDLLCFFETLAAEGYEYHPLRHPSSGEIHTHKLLGILSQHGFAMKTSRTGSSQIHAVLTPKGRDLFDHAYRILKFSWVFRRAKEAHTVDDSAFSDYILSLLTPLGGSAQINPPAPLEDAIIGYADERAGAYVSALFRHVHDGNETDGESQEHD